MISLACSRSSPKGSHRVNPMTSKRASDASTARIVGFRFAGFRFGTSAGPFSVGTPYLPTSTSADALRHSEASLRAIVETTPECVHAIARDGTLVSVNAAGAEMAGAPSVDLVLGRNFYDFVTPEDREQYRAFNESICAGQKGFLEFDIVRMDGARRHLETRAAPLRTEDGTVAQLGIARDITARKQAEARLRESERRLRELTETIPVML